MVAQDTTIDFDNITVARDTRDREDGTLDADISGYNIDLARLRNWIPPTESTDNWFRDAIRHVTGKADAFITASGTLKKPVIGLNANLTDISYNGATVDKINLVHGLIAEPNIKFDNIQFTKRRNTGDQNTELFNAGLANGRLDFSWKPPFVAKDAAFDIDADVPEQDLKVLTAFSRSNNSADSVGATVGLLAPDSDGSFLAHAHVGGTLDKPQPSGVMQVKARQLHFNNLRTGLKDLAAELRFANGSVTVSPGFTGHSYIFAPGVPEKNRSGGPIDLHGSLPLFTPDHPIADQQIVLSAPDVKIDEAPLPGTVIPDPHYGTGPTARRRGSGSLRGDANLDISLRRSFSQPIIGGTIAVSNMTMVPPGGFAPGSGGGGDLPINPEFNLNLTLGRNVWVRNSLQPAVEQRIGINTRLDGTIHLTGNLYKRTPTLIPPLDGAPDAEPGDAPPLSSIAGRQHTAPAHNNEANAITENEQPNNVGLTVLGALTLRGGRLTLPTARFTILPPGTQAPATLTLRYPEFNPAQPGQPTLGADIDLAAQTTLVLPTANAITGHKLYRVTVVARGPITGLAADPVTGQPRLKLNFQTDPPDFSGNQQALQQQVANSLGGSTLEGVGRNPGLAISQQFTNVLSSSIIPDLFDRPASALGFIDLALNYDPIQRLNLVVSRQLLGSLYVTYNRTLSDAYETYDLKVSLRLSNRYQLSYDKDEQDTESILLEGVLKF